MPLAGQIDLGFRSALKLVSKVAQVFSSTPLFSEETLLTIKERQRREDVERKKVFLATSLESAEEKGRDVVLIKDCLSLCKLSGSLIDESIPRVAADILGTVPAVAEENAVYAAWYMVPFLPRAFLRYVNYQVQKRLAVRDGLVGSSFVQMLGRAYSSVTSRLTQGVVRKSLTSPWVDFEHIVLTLVTKLQEMQNNMAEDLKRQDSKTSPVPKNVALVLKALASVMSRQDKAEEYIKEKRFIGENASFIARLSWHKENGGLPPGLPDPAILTPDNLSVELQKALEKHMAKLMERLLDKFAPSEMRNNWIYWLEGKDLLIKIFSSMAVELGVDQLVNPHSLGNLILSAAGYKIEHLELDKFGFRASKTVFDTTQSMLRESLQERPDSESILRKVTQADLKAGCGGSSALEQRRETRDLLTVYVYEMIKKAMGQNLNTSQDKAPLESKLGVAGIANFALQVLISATVHAYKSLKGDLKPHETLAERVKQDFASQSDILVHLAKRIVGLIYHSSSRITVLSVLNVIVESLLTPDHKKEAISEKESKQHFQEVTTFLYGRITVEQFKTFASMLTGDAAFKAFSAAIQPKGESLIKKGVPVLLPIVQELLLYGRVHQHFRNLGCSFAGDAKLAETYVRLYLNHVESFSLSPGVYTEFHVDQVPDRALIRAKLLDVFHKLPPEELIKKLSLDPEVHKDLVRDVELSKKGQVDQRLRKTPTTPPTEVVSTPVAASQRLRTTPLAPAVPVAPVAVVDRSLTKSKPTTPTQTTVVQPSRVKDVRQEHSGAPKRTLYGDYELEVIDGYKETDE